MGRGLSDEQKAILQLLPEYDINAVRSSDLGLTTQEIVELMGKPYTKVNQVSVSRSIRRLRDRKLMWHGWVYRKGRSACTWFSLTKEQGEWLHERSELNRNLAFGDPWKTPAEPYPTKSPCVVPEGG